MVKIWHYKSTAESPQRRKKKKKEEEAEAAVEAEAEAESEEEEEVWRTVWGPGPRYNVSP